MVCEGRRVRKFALSSVILNCFEAMCMSFVNGCCVLGLSVYLWLMGLLL